MAHRFFLTGRLTSEPGRPVPLAPDDVHHAVRVLRVGPGETVELVEADGAVSAAVVVSAGEDGLVVGEVTRAAYPVAQEPHVTLFQGIAKGEKMDAIVRQAVEVGAEAVVPVTMSRTVVRLDAAKASARQDRWQRVAKSAAEQAKRAFVPQVAEPLELRGAIAALGGFDRVVVLWEEHRGTGMAEALAGATANSRVALVVGPEGGLSAEEVAALVERGAVVATLGPTVLRTETAAVVSLALAIAALRGAGGAA